MINRYMEYILVLCCFTLLSGSTIANLATNGGFEVQGGGAQDSAGWSQGGDQGRENWANEWDNWGHAFYGWTSNAAGYIEQHISCDTNATYYFRIRGKRSVGFETGEVDMRMRFFVDATNWVSLAAYTNAAVNIASSTNWTTYEIEATTPTNAGIVQIRCDFSGAINTASANMVFCWDSATLYDRRKDYRSAEIVDEFSYDPDFYDGINAKDRGNGFADVWSNLWGTVDISDYSFTEVNGYPKPYGNKLHIPNTGGACYRSFPAITSGKVYAAVCFNYGNEYQGDWAGLSFLSNEVERVFFGGNSGAQAKMKLAIDSFGGSNRVDSAYDLNAGAGEDYILIGRYDFETRLFSTKAYYKTDEIPLLEPSGWDLSVTLDAGRISYINGIRLAAGNVNPGDVYFDEVRVAENWFDLLNNDKPPPPGMVFSVR